MVRAVTEEALALASLTLFLAMVAVSMAMGFSVGVAGLAAREA